MEAMPQESQDWLQKHQKEEMQQYRCFLPELYKSGLIWQVLVEIVKSKTK